MFEVADRLRNVKISASAAMTRKVRELRAQGVKIVGLSSGEPDFPTPLHAIEAANKAALAGDTKYPPQDGVKPLKEAIQRKFKRDNNLDYALEEIMVSNGSKQIMYDALMASVNPGDEVIIPAPGWISYADQATIAGAAAQQRIDAPRRARAQHQGGSHWRWRGEARQQQAYKAGQRDDEAREAQTPDPFARP